LNEKSYTQLRFFQTLVSLIRDLVIILVVIFTIIITYLGGEPSKLGALDWAELVGAAFVVVLVPLIIFIGSKAALKFMMSDDFVVSYTLSILKAFHRKKHIKKQDIFEILKNERASEEFIQKYPEKAKIIAFYLSPVKRTKLLVTKFQPYFYALGVLILMAVIFIKIISKYIA